MRICNGMSPLAQDLFCINGARIRIIRNAGLLVQLSEDFDVSWLVETRQRLITFSRDFSCFFLRLSFYTANASNNMYAAGIL
jgi:hypothetical protein